MQILVKAPLHVSEVLAPVSHIHRPSLRTVFIEQNPRTNERAQMPLGGVGCSLVSLEEYALLIDLPPRRSSRHGMESAMVWRVPYVAKARTAMLAQSTHCSEGLPFCAAMLLRVLRRSRKARELPPALSTAFALFSISDGTTDPLN